MAAGDITQEALLAASEWKVCDDDSEPATPWPGSGRVHVLLTVQQETYYVHFTEERRSDLLAPVSKEVEVGLSPGSLLS